MFDRALNTPASLLTLPYKKYKCKKFNILNKDVDYIKHRKNH